MTLLDPTVMTVFALAFALVAVVAAALAVTGVVDFVRANRPVRLARHESLRSYYGGLILSH